MDFDDHCDYMDQDIPAGLFSIDYSGPIAQFLTGISGMPDCMNMTPEDINLAVDSLHISLERQTPPGISLQETLEINKRHDIHNRQCQNIVVFSGLYYVLYI